MAKEKIHFFSEEIDFKLKSKKDIRDWLQAVCLEENKKLVSVNIIFCDEARLLEINQEYLNHDYHTDIITFDYAETPGTIEGELYISIDMVTHNAELLKISFESELNRVIVHGILHMIGYEDKSVQKEKEMRDKENYYLLMLNL